MDRLEKARIFRERFFGRQDVYCNIYYNRDGKKSARPSCSLFWQKDCPLKDPSSGITCTNCTIKSPIEVSTQSVLQHIEGEDEHAYYVLQKDGKINFAAFDFDCKDLAKMDDFNNYTFKDVERATAVLRDWGIPYLTARSTTYGYHVYMFFEEAWEASKFRGLIEVLLEKAGFLAEFVHDGRTSFEIFPKQIAHFGEGLGNPIKPPMIEKRFTHVSDQADGRNCLVDDNNIMIPADRQWQTLDQCPRISLEQIEALFLKVEAVEWSTPSLKGEKGSGQGKTVGGRSVNTERRTSLIHGSIEKVIEGCAAMRELVRRIREENYDPKHDEGFALYHMCLNILDGEKWFDLNVPTWGRTNKDKRQLMQSQQKGYTPWTCHKMQEKGICKPGKKCFDKKPSFEIIEGRQIPRPEAEWPEPSPVRYALGKGEDFLLKLINESTEASTDENVETKADKISSIIKRSAVFDDEQRKVLQKHLETLKIQKKTEINQAFNKAVEERTAQEHEATHAYSGSQYVGDTEFLVTDTCYLIVRPGKKGAPSVHIPVTNFLIDILEERSILSEEGVLRTKVLYGKFTSDKRTADFEISTDDWFDANSFIKFFGKKFGTDFNPRKMDIDLIRQIATHSAQTGRPPLVAPVKKIAHYTSVGWYNDVFVMPSVVVDNSGIRANEERPIKLGGGVNEHYNFKQLSESEISATLYNILTDFLDGFGNRRQVMIGLGFTLMASIHRHVKMRGRPIFWLEGLTGVGKTDLTIFLQKFFGEGFNQGFNWDTTALSVMGYAHEARDCTFLMDDYKDSEKERKVCQPILQHTYDGNFRGSLNKDGTQKEIKIARSLFIMSGEEVPREHASILARMVIVKCEKFNTADTIHKYNSIKKHVNNYSGITPLFIHHAITSRSQEELIELMSAVENDLVSEVSERQNVRRVCANLAFIKVGWDLFTEMCRDRSMITQKQATDLSVECMKFIQGVKYEMLERCNDTQSLNVVMDRLKELLSSDTVGIKGLEGYDHINKDSIGFVKSDDIYPNCIYLYPAKTIEAVKRYMTSSPIVISTSSAGDQLKEGGFLQRTGSKGEAQISVRHKSGTSRVWAINMQMIGIQTKPRLVQLAGNHANEDYVQQTQQDDPMLDAEGLI